MFTQGQSGPKGDMVSIPYIFINIVKSLALVLLTNSHYVEPCFALIVTQLQLYFAHTKNEGKQCEACFMQHSNKPAVRWELLATHCQTLLVHITLTN